MVYYQFRDATVPWSPETIAINQCPKCGESLEPLARTLAGEEPPYAWHDHGRTHCPACGVELTYVDKKPRRVFVHRRSRA